MSFLYTGSALVNLSRCSGLLCFILFNRTEKRSFDPEFVSPENHYGPSPQVWLCLMSVLMCVLIWSSVTERSLAVAQQAETSHISPQEYSFGVATEPTSSFIMIRTIDREVTLWSMGSQGGITKGIGLYSKRFSC